MTPASPPTVSSNFFKPPDSGVELSLSPRSGVLGPYLENIKEPIDLNSVFNKMEEEDPE
jgi:hypothetical protein